MGCESRLNLSRDADAVRIQRSARPAIASALYFCRAALEPVAMARTCLVEQDLID